MKLLLVFLLSALSVNPIYLTQKARLVHISCDKKYGTGYWLDNQYILTAKHVVEKQHHTSICTDGTQDDTKTHCAVIVSGEDFSILKSPIKSKFAPIDFGDPVTYGEHVFFWSSYDLIKDDELGRVPILGTGTVAATEFIEDKRPIFLINSLILPGASGSAILNDDGALVGIVHGYYEGEDHVNWYITVNPAKAIKDAYDHLPH